MGKIDLKKQYNKFYKPSAKSIETVNIPVFNFLMIDGYGDPNKSESFQEAINALYSVSYTLKFMIKKSERQIDYSVMPLEGLWWCDDMKNFSIENKDIWKWTLMIMQPDFISNDEIKIAIKTAKEKKDIPAIDNLRMEKFNENISVQTMHIGPFAEEGPTIEKMHNFMKDNNYDFNGKHHEIYLSDIRKAAPEKWKTVLRQPVKKL